MNVVFSLTPSKKVHDVSVKSSNGISFTIDIYEQGHNQFESTVTVFDNLSTNKGSWLYNISSKTASANDNFESAIQFINQYLAQYNQTGFITDVHNPCNCPFVTEQDQNNILTTLQVNLNVRVN
jgi:hypothetical protein